MESADELAWKQFQHSNDIFTEEILYEFDEKNTRTYSPKSLGKLSIYHILTCTRADLPLKSKVFQKSKDIGHCAHQDTHAFQVG